MANHPFQGIEQEVAPGSSIEDFIRDSGNQAPSAPAYGQGFEQASMLPAPMNAFQGAIDTVVEQMRTDTINSPVKPEMAINPFRDPLVSLGLALQGKSAEAVQMGSQIEVQNKRRMDAYNAQLLQAENYRQLRKQRLTTTLAGLQAQAGRSVLEDDYRRTQAEISKARFETTEARLSAQNDATNTYRQAVLDAQNAAKDSTASFTDFLNKDDVFKSAYLNASEQLSTYKRTGKIVVGGQVVDLSAGGSAGSKKAALELFTNDLYAVSDVMRRMGFVEQGLAWENEISLLMKDELATIDDTAIVRGFDVTDPRAQPSGAAEIDMLREQRKLLKSADPTRFEVSGDAGSFDDLLRFADESLARKAETARLDDSRLTPDQQQKITIQGLSGRINEAIDRDPTKTDTPEIKSDVKGLAIAEMRSFSSEVDALPDRVTAIKTIVRKLTIEHGIPAVLLRNVRKLIGKEYDQLLENQVAREDSRPGAFKMLSGKI